MVKFSGRLRLFVQRSHVFEPCACSYRRSYTAYHRVVVGNDPCCDSFAGERQQALCLTRTLSYCILRGFAADQPERRGPGDPSSLRLLGLGDPSCSVARAGRGRTAHCLIAKTDPPKTTQSLRERSLSGARSHRSALSAHVGLCRCSTYQPGQTSGLIGVPVIRRQWARHPSASPPPSPFGFGQTSRTCLPDPDPHHAWAFARGATQSTGQVK